MKLDENTPKSMDLGFEIPEAGTYRWQTQEGIDLFHNENSGKTSLKIPLKIDQVIDGSEESVGLTAIQFIPIETKFGEKQLTCLLSITGLMPHFMQKFSGDIDPLKDERFMTELKLKLPGKFLQATHDVRENQKGQKNVNFTNFCEVGKKKAGEKGSTLAQEDSKQEQSSW